jgi:tetratricopeptide (TPR) repeat protein
MHPIFLLVVSLGSRARCKRDLTGMILGMGRTTVSKDYAVGDSSIWVTSAMELFGPLVELVKSDTDGRFTLQFISNAAPRTVQLGEHSPCVNVEKVVNNQLFVTPISVRGSGYENDPVVFGSCGPSGLTGLADRINKPGLAAQDARRVDMTAVRAEIEALESIGIDTAAGSKHETAKKIEAAKGKPGGGFKTEKQIEAEETEERADACFWDGLMNEKMDDPVKIFYCPFIDSRAECGLNARLAYTEAARLFGRCIDLENTHLTYYAKRCMSLCKLRMFARALPDAENYAKMRPDSPTGHCLKGVVYDGLNMYNQSIATLQHALDCAEIIPYDGSRVWSLGTLVADNLEKAVERRAQVADRARVSNQHGVKWRTLGQYDRAIPCLIEAAQLQKQCVGDAHLHYATCLNNLGACLEAMGNYDDALQQYKNSLLVCEIASPGTLRSAIFSARHLPYIMKGGALQEGEWVEGGESSDTYVEVEIVGGANTSRGDHAVCTKVVADSLQPTWNQVLSLKLPRGDCSVIVRLVCRNPQRHALQEAATEKRQMIGGCPSYLSVPFVDSHVFFSGQWSQLPAQLLCILMRITLTSFGRLSPLLDGCRA